MEDNINAGLVMSWVTAFSGIFLLNMSSKREPSRMSRYLTAVGMDRKLGRCTDVKCQAHTDSDYFCLLSGRSTQSLWRHLRSRHPEIAEEEDAILADE